MMLHNDRAFATACSVMGVFILFLITGITTTLGRQGVRWQTNQPALIVVSRELPVTTAAATTTEPVKEGEVSDLVDLTDKQTVPERGEETYLRVIDSCNYQFSDDCLVVRSGPGTEYPIVSRLRNNVVLKAGEAIEGEDRTWYQVVFDEWLRYPERLTENWYVAADFVEPVFAASEESSSANRADPVQKRIVVDRSEQKLYAYENGDLFMEIPVSTGLELSPTPRGTFTVFKKTPTRYMQGPLPYIKNSDYYDLPGVPWNLYFTEQGAVIHGAYWHDSFGSRYSHGCVNLDPADAEALYRWTEIGTTVVIQD